LIQAQRKQSSWEILITFTVNKDTPTFLKYDEGKGMTFDGRTLKIPDLLTLHFTTVFKKYEPYPHIPSLHQFRGKINQTEVEGYSYFQPIPLLRIGGEKRITKFSNDTQTLEIISDNEIKFTDTESKNNDDSNNDPKDFLYIPWSRILTIPAVGILTPAVRRDENTKVTVFKFTFDEKHPVCRVSVFEDNSINVSVLDKFCTDPIEN